MPRLTPPDPVEASSAKTVTWLLSRLSDGDEAASQELYARVYGEMHTLAQGLMRDQRQAHTLQPTALVHEAWLRLADPGNEPPTCEGRKRFFALASTVMRSILVDHARARAARKRGGDQAVVPLGLREPEVDGPDLDVLALDEALVRLAAIDERLARVVELRYFGGLTNAEVSEVLGIAERTVEDDARLARAWLRVELER